MTIIASSAYEAQYFLKLLFFFFFLWVGEGKAGSCYVVQTGLEPTILLPGITTMHHHAWLKFPFLAWEVWVGSILCFLLWYSHAVEGPFSGLEGGLCALESHGDLLCNW